MERHIFLIAGEISGDRLGADLMRGLASYAGTARFSGIGGPAMMQAGLKPLFNYSELSVMGLFEVLPRLPHLFARIRETADSVIGSGADALITIDSPDFTLRVARLVRQACPELPIIHYVSPSIWAWRPARLRKLRGVVDHVLALLPFEPELLQAGGIDATFVGHPAGFMESVSVTEMNAGLGETGLDRGSPILTILPGSRRNEVRRLAPVFGKAAELFLRRCPEYQIAVIAAESVAPLVRQEIQNWSFRPQAVVSDAVAKHGKSAVFAASSLALAASGTVTLELARAETPMVVAYDVNFLSRVLISRLLRVDTVTLVNLISGTREVPELLGRQCQPMPIYEQLQRLHSDQDARKRQLAASRQAIDLLRSRGEPPGQVAAATVLRTIGTCRGDAE
ncbi:MAG: lipid-A-disaccharide synthase [Rhodobacteraceae bacterium]|nr:lipid-A-disaccharide synthase [Paracoccaceae bacterium]